MKEYKIKMIDSKTGYVVSAWASGRPVTCVYTRKSDAKRDIQEFLKIWDDNKTYYEANPDSKLHTRPEYIIIERTVSCWELSN